MHRIAIALTGLLAMSSARADPPKSPPTAPSKLVGTYKRVPGKAPHDLTADKASTCGDDASDHVRKMAENISSVTVLSNSITMNTGKPNAITFASQDSLMSNVVIDRDDRFTTALRIIVVDGALTITYNKVERETADWCSVTWGVMIQRN